jgi:hypothetical protein
VVRAAFRFFTRAGSSMAPPRPPLRRLSLLVAAISGVLTLVVLPSPRTRWAALLFDPAAALAPSLSVHPFYVPWAFFVWDWRFGRSPGAPSIFATGHWLIGIPAHAFVLVAVFVSARHGRRLDQHTDSHGSARARVVAQRRVGGLHHRYTWRDAA